MLLGAKGEAASEVVCNHRSVDRDHAAGDRRVDERRRVAVADDRLRPGREWREIELGEEPLAAVAAAGAEDCAQFGRANHPLEIAAPHDVVPRQIGPALEDTVPQHHPKPPALEHLHACAERVLVDRSRRRDHPDGISAADPRRLTDRRAVQSRVEIPARVQGVKRRLAKRTASV